MCNEAVTDEDLAGLVVRLRLQGSDDARVEAKAAAGDTPKSLWSTVSAFANTDGGTIILGLDEGTGFAPAGYLALAAYPQQRLPQLTVDVAVHPATAESQRADLRFVDRQTCDGVLCENQGSGVPLWRPAHDRGNA